MHLFSYPRDLFLVGGRKGVAFWEPATSGHVDCIWDGTTKNHSTLRKLAPHKIPNTVAPAKIQKRTSSCNQLFILKVSLR